MKPQLTGSDDAKPFLTGMEGGKSLEIDGLLTGTLEIARKAGVAAPYTESLLGMIRVRAQSTGQYAR